MPRPAHIPLCVGPVGRWARDDGAAAIFLPLHRRLLQPLQELLAQRHLNGLLMENAALHFRTLHRFAFCGPHLHGGVHQLGRVGDVEGVLKSSLFYFIIRK